MCLISCTHAVLVLPEACRNIHIHTKNNWPHIVSLHGSVSESSPARAQVGDGVFEVLSTSGDTHLGGDDFDKRIVDFLAEDFQRGEGIDLRKDRQALQRLMEASEKAKMELSTLSQARGLRCSA